MIDPLMLSLVQSGIGGGLSLLGKKTPAQTTQLPTLTPEQQQSFSPFTFGTPKFVQQFGQQFGQQAENLFGQLNQNQGENQSQFGQFLFGKPQQERRIDRFTGEQGSALDQLLQQGGQNANFQGIEDLARKRFQENTIPSLAERFTSFGQGGQRSSDFMGAAAGAGADLESQLGGLRGQFGMQQLQQGLQPRFDTTMQPGTPGVAQGGIQALLQMLPMLLSL